MPTDTVLRLSRLLILSFVFQPLSVRAVARADAAGPVGLFDTGISSSAPLSPKTLTVKDGWTRLPEDQTAHDFAGDAVLTNGRLIVVLRRGGPGAEVYCNAAEGPTLRTTLTPAAGSGDLKLASVAIAENSSSTVAADVTFKSQDDDEFILRHGLTIGQLFVQTEARAGLGALRVEAPCRFLVLPDFFADDLVVDAAEIPVDRAELPSENFLLHMLPDHRSIVMSVSNARERDAVIRLSGRGAQRTVGSSEIAYGKDGKIWVAVIQGRGVWHRREIGAEQTDQVLRLDWSAPYPAQWRVDWRRDDGLTGSWEMITEKDDGRFEKHGWFGSPAMVGEDRKRWTTVLGRFRYPCWIDRGGRGYLQPLDSRVVRFRGPALIYPINRASATPLDEFTVVDVVRATLGVGPCQYILDVEGQGAPMKGRATCATRDALKAIYSRNQQKQKRDEIERLLDDVLVFVRHIRGRIDAYVDFGHDLRRYLRQQQDAHPELTEFLGEMDGLARTIDTHFERRSESIKTTQYVADLTARFRATLLDYQRDDALARCTQITHAIVKVGGAQDELVGECRMAVKVLRQRAGLAMAVDPRAGPLAGEIRRRTQQVLRNAASYEAPRH